MSVPAGLDALDQHTGNLDGWDAIMLVAMTAVLTTLPRSAPAPLLLSFLLPLCQAVFVGYPLADYCFLPHGAPILLLAHIYAPSNRPIACFSLLRPRSHCGQSLSPLELGSLAMSCNLSSNFLPLHGAPESQTLTKEQLRPPLVAPPHPCDRYRAFSLIDPSEDS